MAKSSEAQIADIGRELSTLVEGATRDIGRSLIAELPAVTPRDTGFTAASWRASRGRPVTAPIGSRSASGVASARAAQDASRSEIETFRLSDGTLHVANPLPNAEALDRGTSSQEPRAFVARAIVKATASAAAAAAVRGAVGRRRGR